VVAIAFAPDAKSYVETYGASDVYPIVCPTCSTFWIRTDSVWNRRLS